MMYIIYNHDGSIKTLIVDESIQQNNNGVNQIFVSIDGYEPADYTCVAYFELPNGTLNNVVGIADTGVEVGELTYDGYTIVLTNAQTVYAGKLKMSIKLVDLQDNHLCTYQTELQVNPTSAVPSETLITNAQYNSLVQSLRSYVLYSDLVNYADKEWVEDNYLSLEGGEITGNLTLNGNFIFNNDGGEILIKSGANTYLYDLPLQNGTLALVSQVNAKQNQLYRHHFAFTGDGGYAVNFELINKTSSSMTISGSIDSNNVLTFSNVSSDFAYLRYIMATSAEQYLIVSMNFVYSTTTTGTLKMKVYRIQNDGTLSPITTYTTLNDTVEAL